MVNLDISVPESLKSFIEQQAMNQGFSSVGAYMRAVLEEIKKQHEKKELEHKLLDGLNSPLVEMTNQDWNLLEKEVC
jgi:Arc/MetJ-type ribon-helix-helix transcriptional regulator